jgi:hypothetical protein
MEATKTRNGCQKQYTKKVLEWEGTGPPSRRDMVTYVLLAAGTVVVLVRLVLEQVHSQDL